VADLLSQLYGAKEVGVNHRGRGPSGEEMISKHYQGENLAIVVETVANSLLVSGPAERVAEIEALVQRLEQPPAENRPLSLRSVERSQIQGAGRGVRTVWPAMENHRAEYERLDREASQAAAEYRQTRAAGEGPQSAEQRDKQKAELRDRVAAAFAARQTMQRAELNQLREQFTRIERQIASREQIQDEIIDRRVEELINPNLQWAPGPSPASGFSSLGGTPRSSGQTQSLPRNYGLEAAAGAESSPPRAASSFSPRTSAAVAGSDLAVLEAKLAAAEQRLSHLRREHTPQNASEVGAVIAAVDVARAELEHARREHATKEQLLLLDLEAATLRVDAAKALLAEAEDTRRRSPDAISENVIAERRSSLRQAELEVQRAETLLEAHRRQGGRAGTHSP
jgi:hypothetical protein